MELYCTEASSNLMSLLLLVGTSVAWWHGWSTARRDLKKAALDKDEKK